jgi:hypothetical protein
MAAAALDPGRTPTGGSPRIPWLVLAALFGLAEMFVLHVQIRREAQTSR